jgi:hypothetical protein
MKKYLLLLLSIFLFAGTDTTTIPKLGTQGYNYEVWGGIISLDSLDTTFIETAIKIGSHNIFSVDLIQGDSTALDMFLGTLITDIDLKPWDWHQVAILGVGDSAWVHGWTEDSLPLSIYAWFRIANLKKVDRDTVYFRFKQHAY